MILTVPLNPAVDVTVVGVALFGFVGAECYRDFDEARRTADFSVPVYEPSGD